MSRIYDSRDDEIEIEREKDKRLKEERKKRIEEEEANEQAAKPAWRRDDN